MTCSQSGFSAHAITLSFRTMSACWLVGVARKLIRVSIELLKVCIIRLYIINNLFGSFQVASCWLFPY